MAKAPPLAILPNELPVHKVTSAGGLIDPGSETNGTKIVLVAVSEQPKAFVIRTVTVD